MVDECITGMLYVSLTALSAMGSLTNETAFLPAALLTLCPVTRRLITAAVTHVSNAAQTPTQADDPNIRNSYLVNESLSGGDGSLTELGQTYANFPC